MGLKTTRHENRVHDGHFFKKNAKWSIRTPDRLAAQFCSKCIFLKPYLAILDHAALLLAILKIILKNCYEWKSILTGKVTAKMSCIQDPVLPKPKSLIADLAQSSKWSPFEKFFGQKQTFGRPCSLKYVLVGNRLTLIGEVFKRHGFQITHLFHQKSNEFTRLNNSEFSSKARSPTLKTL